MSNEDVKKELEEFRRRKSSEKKVATTPVKGQADVKAELEEFRAGKGRGVSGLPISKRTQEIAKRLAPVVSPALSVPIPGITRGPWRQEIFAPEEKREEMRPGFLGAAVGARYLRGAAEAGTGALRLGAEAVKAGGRTIKDVIDLYPSPAIWGRMSPDEKEEWQYRKNEIISEWSEAPSKWKNTGLDVLEGIQEYYQDKYAGISEAPQEVAARELIRDPFGTTTDIAALLSGAGVGLRGLGVAAQVARGGRIAKGIYQAGRSLERASATIDPLNIASDIIAKTRPMEKAFALTVNQREIEKYGGRMEAARAKIKGVMHGDALEDIHHVTKVEYYQDRGKLYDLELRAMEKLLPQELDDFHLYTQGLKIPDNPSPALQEALAIRGKIADDYAKWLVKKGHMTEEGVMARRYKPLMDETEKRADELFKKAMAAEGKEISASITGFESAQEQIKRIGRSRDIATKLSVGDEVSKADLDWFRSRGIKEPIYFHHTFGDRNISDQYMAAFPKRSKFAFLKKYKGTGKDYITEPAEVIKRNTAQMMKFVSQERYLQRIVQHPDVFEITNQKVLKNPKFWDNLRARDYTILAPDAIRVISRGQKKINKAFVDEAVKSKSFSEAAFAGLEASIKETREALDELSKQRAVMLGAKGQPAMKVYAVPTAMIRRARQLSEPSRFTGTWAEPFARAGNWTSKKVIGSILGWRPAWMVNNFMGNLQFSLLHGTAAPDFVRQFSKEARALIPEEVNYGLFSQQKGLTYGQRATSNNLLWRAAKGVDDIHNTMTRNLFDFNRKTEGFFRNAAYLTEARRLAKTRLMQRAGRRFYTSQDLIAEMRRIKASPKLREQVIKEMEYFFGDYRKLNMIERRFLRQAAPFYSWIKHMNKLAISLPFKHPKRAFLMRHLGELGKELYDEDLPKEMQGKVMVIGDTDADTSIALSLRGWNIWESLLDSPEKFITSIHPLAGTALAYATGREPWTGVSYKRGDIKPYGNKYYRMKSDGDGRNYYKDIDWDNPLIAVRPPLGSMVARMFPQVLLAERMLKPYPTYTGAGIFERGARPQYGKVRYKSPIHAAARYLGVPLTEIPSAKAYETMEKRGRAKLAPQFAREEVMRERTERMIEEE